MSCRKATTASTYGMGLSAMFAPNTVGADFNIRPLRESDFNNAAGACPRCMEIHPNNRRRTSEPALCKGRCRAERGGGVVPDRNYFSFLLCNLHAFTIPQALARQLPLHKGAFLDCANIAGDLLPQGAAVTMHRLLGENLTP